jgi:NAD(P)-dependent dehydrogenase (short-subunit alcohol dehydrogenase family)
MAIQQRPLAVVTGASSGIGRELALLAARRGFDLIVAADQPLEEVAEELQGLDATPTSPARCI